jgi:hypothetical protein
MTNKARLVVAVVSAALLAILGWQLLYPDPGDPKNIKYILWKAGILRIALSQATATMVGDGDRDSLVVGKTRVEIEHRFGPLITIEQATPYLTRCYQQSPWAGRAVSFIADSPWMVVFGGEKANELVLLKGC